MQDNTQVSEATLWLGLHQIHGIGSQTFCLLLREFGNPENTFNASISQLKKVVPANIAEVIAKGVDVSALESILEWLCQPGNHLITLADANYPKALLEITDPPVLLFAKGNLQLLNTPAIGVVGSRNASVQGEKNAENFSHDLAQAGLTIVSGLALGIDGAAHRGALRANGATIAVVGTGLDIVYPAKHRDLAHQIVGQGLIISEFTPGTPSKAQNFPKRNRIISGLSLGCLVVEANIQSGSLITARLCAEQGREVFAMPGSIHSPMSKGCHQLIKQGAKLVDCIEDILTELKHVSPLATSNGLNNDLQLNKINKEQQIIDLMGYDAISIEELARMGDLTISELSAMLMLMELENKIATLPGGKYQKIS